MELDDLKSTWAALDDRLKNNEKLNESIILEMAKSKANKSINRLINYDIFGIIILALIIPYFVYMSNFHSFNKLLTFKFLLIYVIIYCIAYIAWYFLKIHGLMKIDFSKSLSNNIHFANRYKIQLKREKLLTNFIAAPILLILVTCVFAEANANTFQWTSLVCGCIVGIIIAYWQYKRLYDKNIETILKSLEEIRELKEE